MEKYKMKYVYIVEAGFDYEGSDVKGVYSNEEAAKKAELELEGYDHSDYYEVEVQDELVEK